MNNKEKRILDTVDESVYFCLQRGIDKKQIAEWLDDVISDLSEDTSSELFNILYRIQDNLLYGYEFQKVIIMNNIIGIVVLLAGLLALTFLLFGAVD